MIGDQELGEFTVSLLPKVSHYYSLFTARCRVSAAEGVVSPQPENGWNDLLAVAVVLVHSPGSQPLPLFGIA
jgi:hypothetical protein